MIAQILPSGTNSILCGDNYYAFFDKDGGLLKVEDKIDTCISKLTVADLPPVSEEFMEQWILKTLLWGSDEVVRHFMELESVKEWFAKKGISPWMFPERKPWWIRLLRIFLKKTKESES